MRASFRAGAAMTIVLATATLARAGTGSIKGTVTGGASNAPVANAVVMVDGPPGTAPSARAVIDQRDDTFVPHVLAIPAGTSVAFANSDPHLHNVFSASPAKKFDLGMYGQGEAKSVTFETPGVVRVKCNAHPKMEALIVVHANPYIAVTDAHGAYTITGVPAGRYDVRVWDERLGETRDLAEVRDAQVTPLDVRLTAKR